MANGFPWLIDQLHFRKLVPLVLLVDFIVKSEVTTKAVPKYKLAKYYTFYHTHEKWKSKFIFLLILSIELLIFYVNMPCNIIKLIWYSIYHVQSLAKIKIFYEKWRTGTLQNLLNDIFAAWKHLEIKWSIPPYKRNTVHYPPTRHRGYHKVRRVKFCWS